MTQQTKTAALLAAALAYYERRLFLQYDQRSMDRILQLTPRPRKFLPPEAATEGNTTYLDCSSFVNAVYYQTFGEELEADLTWHMVDYVKPRLFFYEMTHRETPEEIAALRKEITALLRPGDVIVFDRTAGSGHTLLILDDEKYIHCTSGGRPDSYDFVNKKSREYPDGGIRMDLISDLLSGDPAKRTLFRPNTRRIAVMRPLARMGDPTESAMLRLNAARELCCGVEVSHPGAVLASVGDAVTYTVFVRNWGKETRDVQIRFTPPAGTEFSGESCHTATVPPGERECVTFSVPVREMSAPWLDAPRVSVNALEIYAPRVLLADRPDENRIREFTARIREKAESGASVWETAADAFAALDIPFPATEQCAIRKFFRLHDSTGGDVLSRRPQNPRKEAAVYAMFGGIGVVTPELASADGMRTVKIRPRDLLPGDILLCSDDPYGGKTYSCCYTGDGLIGRFDAEDGTRTLTGEALDAFVDSLFGRFCFILLRPLYNSEIITEKR